MTDDFDDGYDQGRASRQAEIEQLLEAKRMAGLIADERSRENVALRAALEIIAGRRQCIDNTMSHQEVAIAALEQGASALCKTCDGTGEVDGPADVATYRLPCPDCGT